MRREEREGRGEGWEGRGGEKERCAPSFRHENGARGIVSGPNFPQARKLMRFMSKQQSNELLTNATT